MYTLGVYTANLPSLSFGTRPLGLISIYGFKTSTFLQQVFNITACARGLSGARSAQCDILLCSATRPYRFPLTFTEFPSTDPEINSCVSFWRSAAACFKGPSLSHCWAFKPKAMDWSVQRVALVR